MERRNLNARLLNKSGHILKFSHSQIPKLICFLPILAGCTLSSNMNSEEAAIRFVRETSNAAIAAHDTTALGLTLAPDYHVVTSRNSESSGRQAMLARFAADAKDVIYVRTPDAIRVFPEWKMASETGTWIGRWSQSEEKIELSGTYFAKWHKVDGVWLIRAEIFVPLKCTGGKYCDQGPI